MEHDWKDPKYTIDHEPQGDALDRIVAILLAAGMIAVMSMIYRTLMSGGW